MRAAEVVIWAEVSDAARTSPCAPLPEPAVKVINPGPEIVAESGTPARPKLLASLTPISIVAQTVAAAAFGYESVDAVCRADVETTAPSATNDDAAV